MLVRTPADLATMIRDRRKKLGLNQAELDGRARAELGLVLRTLDELGIRLETKERVKPPPGPDIDSIIAAARRGRT
jgi:HTH-type transcriptional regulator / antitoxin HipB